MGKAIKSMTLEQAQSYQKELKSAGRKDGKEYGKVTDYIKTMMPDAEQRFGRKDLGNAYSKLSRGVEFTGGWTEQNLDNIEAYTGARPQLRDPNATGGSSDGGLGSYLQSFQDGVFNNASDVELRESIAAQLEPDGMESPEPINYVEMFESYRDQYGVDELESALNDLKAEQRDQDAIRRQRIQTAEGGQVAMGVIAGRVSEIERQENERMDVINREIAYITDQLNTAYTGIEMYMDFEKMTYDDARQAYQDAFNKNLQIYKLVDEEMDEQVANAKANLQTIQNAILSGNINYGDLSASQKTTIAKLEAQAQLPIGFTSNLQINPKDNIIATSKDGSQISVWNADGTFSLYDTGITPSSSGSTGTTAAAYDKAFADARADLDRGVEWGAVWDDLRSRFPELSNEDIDTRLRKADYTTSDAEGNEAWRYIPREGDNAGTYDADLSNAVYNFQRASSIEDETLRESKQREVQEAFARLYPDKVEEFLKAVQ